MIKAIIGTSVLAASLLVGGTAPAAAAQAKPTFGPYGYGPVKLGMSLKKARATGAIVPKGPVKGSCTHWDLKRFPTGKDASGVIISRKEGVVGIEGRKGMKTPEGIRIGSTYKRLKKAYPRLYRRIDNAFRVDGVPGNRNKKVFYEFTVAKGKVTHMFMGISPNRCFG